jgi:Chitinase
MSYYKIGYVGDGYLPHVTEEDAKILTHINIAFGLVENGFVKYTHLKNSDYIAKIRSYNPDIKILLSVGGWGAGGFSNAASTEEGCDKFAASALAAYNVLGLDGIDIDWEYPCIGSAGIDYSPNDKVTFTTMMRKLREVLPEKAMLTIAAGAGDYFIESTEMATVATYLDYVQLMTYDMCGGKTTLHHTNLYTAGTIRKSSGDYAVGIFNAAGIPLEKLILGAAFYSRDWRVVTSTENDGLYQKSETPIEFGPGFSDLYENYIDKNGYVRHWDDTAKAPYLFNGKHFITYDDEESIALKCKYIKDKKIGGIMYWEHSCDETRRLLRTIGDNL